MKENELAGAWFMGIIVVFSLILVGGVTHSKGYNSGYDDAEAGKERYGLKYGNPYPYTYGSGDDALPDVEDDYLRDIDEINKGGNEYGNKSGEEYKGYWNQDDKDRSEA